MGGGAVAVRLPRRHLVPDRPAAAVRHDLQVLPSYWLVQAGHVGLGGRSRGVRRAGVVIAVWTVAWRRFAMWAYRRDTSASEHAYPEGAMSTRQRPAWACSPDERGSLLPSRRPARMWGGGWRRYFFPGFWLVYLGQTVDGVGKTTRRAPAAVSAT